MGDAQTALETTGGGTWEQTQKQQEPSATARDIASKAAELLSNLPLS
jgi:hypothetical protein